MTNARQVPDELAPEVRWRFAAGLSEKAIAAELEISGRLVRGLVKAERLEAAWEPWCMSEEDFETWRIRGTVLNGQPAGQPWTGKGGLMRPCEDCPASYAAEMRGQGRCNGEPGERRRSELPPLIAAVTSPPEPAEEAQMLPSPPPLAELVSGLEPPIAAVDRSSRREVLAIAEPPCRDCAHQDVCKIRDELGSQQVEILARPLPAALAVVATAEISCMYFLPIAVAETPPPGGLERLMAAVREVDQDPDDELLRTAGHEDAASDGVDDRPGPLEHGRVEAADAPEGVTDEPSAAIPADAAGEAGAAAPPAPRLSRRQAEVLAAVVSADGAIPTAAGQLKCSRALVNMTLRHIGKKGLLPAELIARLPASFARYATVEP